MTRDGMLTCVLPMRLVRRHLATILFGWLLFQFFAIAAPLVLTAAGTMAAEEICTCPGGSANDNACPMHHREGPQSRNASRCMMQNACAPLDAALLSLARGAAVLPQRTSLQILTVQRAVPIPDVPLDSRTEVPDSPPPRA